MKNGTRITTFMVIASCLFISSIAVAQNKAFNNSSLNAVEITPATISNNFVIRLPDEQGAFSSTYLLDIKSLSFRSEEILQQFCSIFSTDYFKLQGDFQKNQITLELDQKTIQKKGFSKVQVNAFFEEIAKRMEFIFHKFNN